MAFWNAITRHSPIYIIAGHFLGVTWPSTEIGPSKLPPFTRDRSGNFRVFPPMPSALSALSLRGQVWVLYFTGWDDGLLCFAYEWDFPYILLKPKSYEKCGEKYYTSIMTVLNRREKIRNVSVRAVIWMSITAVAVFTLELIGRSVTWLSVVCFWNSPVNRTQ